MKTFLISIPTDEDGFLGRACDAPGCKQYFKICLPDHRETPHCPYCGEEFHRNSLFTREQTDHVRRAAVEEARVFAITEFQKMLKDAFRGSKAITYKPGSAPRKRPVFARYSERKVDTELQCSECQTRFQVYGIFGFCPGCSCENLQLYDANWAIIKRDVVNAADQHRQLRHAYSDLVSTFEAFCSRKAKQISVEGGNFQILFEARKFFKNHASIDILAGLTTGDLLTLRRVFQKRHVCIHAGGKITDRYLQMIPEDTGLLGTPVTLSLQELEEGANAMRAALGALVKAIERPGK